MCARVWQLKCACTRAGDAIPICSTIAANGVLQLTRVGSVHASVQPCRSRGSVPASKPGSEDLLERRERRRERRCARPRPPTRARISSWSHRRTRTTLTRACARDEQMVARHRLIRHRRHHGRRRRRHLSSPPLPSPLRWRSNDVLVAASVRAIRDPGSDPRQRVCLGIGCSFAGGCCGCPWGAVGSARSAYVRAESRLCRTSMDPSSARMHTIVETAESCPCVSIWSWHVVNTVPNPSGDPKGPYFALTSITVANTTTPNLHPGPVWPTYKPYSNQYR